MMRCDVCGRSLVGLRADHPFHCRIETALRAPCPRSLVVLEFDAGVPDRALVSPQGWAEATVEASRIGIHDGDPLDPFAPSEGPAQRGYTMRGHRLAS